MLSGNQTAYETPDLIVFDLDGTLTDVSDKAARLSSVTDKLNIPVSTATYWLMKKAHQFYKNAGFKNRTAETIKDDVLRTLCNEKADMFYVLSAAYDAYIPCSILSNGPREWGEKILKRLQLRMFFNQTVFREDMTHLKPEPHSLLALMDEHESLKGKAATVWVCGDRTSDVALALNTGTFVPHKIIPVAFHGTKAAQAIGSLRDQFNIEGYVFEDPYKMACALDPDMEYRIKRTMQSLKVVQTHISTLTLQ